MKTDVIQRSLREKAFSEEGSVYRETARLHKKYSHVFTCPNTRRGEQYLDALLARIIPGKDILDYGCFDGWMVPYYSEMKPRSITGIDIWEQGIEVARRNFGSIASFLACDAHSLSLRDNTYDVVVGNSILHHLDFKVAVMELRRILRPGGYAVFQEPLRDNPVGHIFRALTPTARTKDEVPLTRQQIAWADEAFGASEHIYVNLLSVPVAMATSLVRVTPCNVALRLADQLDVLFAQTSLRHWMRRVYLVWRNVATC